MHKLGLKTKIGMEQNSIFKILKNCYISLDHCNYHLLSVSLCSDWPLTVVFNEIVVMWAKSQNLQTLYLVFGVGSFFQLFYFIGIHASPFLWDYVAQIFYLFLKKKNICLGSASVAHHIFWSKFSPGCISTHGRSSLRDLTGSDPLTF